LKSRNVRTLGAKKLRRSIQDALSYKRKPSGHTVYKYTGINTRYINNLSNYEQPTINMKTINSSH